MLSNVDMQLVLETYLVMLDEDDNERLSSASILANIVGKRHVATYMVCTMRIILEETDNTSARNMIHSFLHFMCIDHDIYSVKYVIDRVLDNKDKYITGNTLHVPVLRH